MNALLHLIHRPPGTMIAEDRLAQCHALVADITDALLSCPEPHRTNFMREFTPLRDALLALRVSS